MLDAIGSPAAPARPTGDDGADAARAAALLARLRRDPAALAPAIPAAAVPLAWRFDRARAFIRDGRAFAPVTPEELDRADREAARLNATAADATLCHGDFLDKNILVDPDDRWWAIDPMPCVGDPCLDAGFWALHHRPGEAVAERCALVADAAALDPARVQRWARAFAASEAVLDIGQGRAPAHLAVLRD